MFLNIFGKMTKFCLGLFQVVLRLFHHGGRSLSHHLNFQLWYLWQFIMVFWILHCCHLQCTDSNFVLYWWGCLFTSIKWLSEIINKDTNLLTVLLRYLELSRNILVYLCVLIVRKDRNCCLKSGFVTLKYLRSWW